MGEEDKKINFGFESQDYQRCIKEFGQIPDITEAYFGEVALSSLRNRYLDQYFPASEDVLFHRASPTCRKLWPLYFDSQIQIRFSSVDQTDFLKTGKIEDLTNKLPVADREQDLLIYFQMKPCPPCDRVEHEVFTSLLGYQLTHPQEKKKRIAVLVQEGGLSVEARRRLALTRFPTFIFHSQNGVNFRQARIKGYENKDKFAKNLRQVEEVLQAPKDPTEILREKIDYEEGLSVVDLRKVYDLKLQLGILYLEVGKTEDALSLLQEVAHAPEAQPIKKNCTTKEELEEYVWSTPAFMAQRTLLAYYRKIYPDYHRVRDISLTLDLDYQWLTPPILFHADALYRMGDSETAVKFLVERWRVGYTPLNKPPLVWEFSPEEIRFFLIGQNGFQPKAIAFLEGILLHRSSLRPEVTKFLEQMHLEMNRRRNPFIVRVNQNAS